MRDVTDQRVSRPSVAQIVERGEVPIPSGIMTTATTLPAHRTVSPAAVLVRLGMLTSALVSLMMF